MPEDKLLAVEDNPLIVRAIELAAEQLHLRVDVATDGWDAIEKLRDSHYVAVVIDSEVPRRSGFGVLTWLRQENGEAFENVVLMTDRRQIRQVSDRLRVIPRTDAVEEIAAAVAAALH